MSILHRVVRLAEHAVVGALVLGLVHPFLRVAAAQSTKIELGLDGGVAVVKATGVKTVTDVELPAQTFRIGFMVSDNVSFEPFGSLSHLSGDGSSTSYEVGAGLLLLMGGHTETQYFLRPLVAVTGVSGTGIKSSNPFEFGAGVGVKIPIEGRLGARLEAGYERTTKANIVPASNIFFATVGLSFHTW